jgi:hypothetical protein
MLPSLSAGNAEQKTFRSAFVWRTTQPYSTYGLRLCLPAATVLPIVRNEKFGTSSFYEQLLGQAERLACVCNVQGLRTARQPWGTTIPHPILGIGFVDLLQVLRALTAVAAGF